MKSFENSFGLEFLPKMPKPLTGMKKKKVVALNCVMLNKIAMLERVLY